MHANPSCSCLLELCLQITSCRPNGICYKCIEEGDLAGCQAEHHLWKAIMHTHSSNANLPATALMQQETILCWILFAVP